MHQYKIGGDCRLADGDFFYPSAFVFVNVLGGGEGDPDGHPSQLHEHAAAFLSDALQLLHQKVMLLVRTFNSDAIKGSERMVCV